MMVFTPRGLRLAKALENYGKTKPMFFDTSNLFSKVKITSINENFLQGTLTVDSSMCNGTNIIHGGYIASLMDIACLYGNLGKSNGRMGMTTNMNINFIKIAERGETLIIETDTIKNGNIMPVLEACLRKENGDLVAKGTFSYKIGNEAKQHQCKELLGFDIFLD